MNSPLGWTGDGPADVGTHLANARNVAGTVMTIDGSHPGDLEALPAGAVCTLMIMLNQELQAVTEILEREGASLTLDASVIRAIDGLYDDVIDAGILLANVPGEKEQLSRQDRTLTDCFNEACPKFSTIFAAIGKPHTRKPQSDQRGES